jgi:hypothetical protein
VSSSYERMWREQVGLVVEHDPGICVEKLRKTTKISVAVLRIG